MKKCFLRYSILILSILLISFSSFAQSFDTSLLNGLEWRSIGPYRGGRTVGAAGSEQQPNVFYIGVNNGGVWKSTDYGITWQPVFDKQSTGSIGTIAVAPSDPNIIYVGSGEGLHRPDLSVGNGIYKSTDAGKTWSHLGLRDGQQVPQIAIDPANPNRLFVAVLGHPYGPNTERGIFRSEDGGKTFEKVLYIDENTGGDDVAIDPKNPNNVYATLWKSREGPWENGEWDGTEGGIYKSIDGGATWKKMSQGLPQNMVQAHIAIAPSSPNILYVAIGTNEPNAYGTGSGMGMYRSDNGGENWYKISDEDGRPEARIGGGDVPVLEVDPKDPETVYSTSIVVYRSVDGGKTWKGIRGAPGGDDYQNMWINPGNPKILLVTGDQGAIITVNGGSTWSSWYNQPTAQLYHVSADNDFPYHLYSGQQESGSVGIASRSNDGEITFRDWHPVGAQEYGYVAPDPLNSNIVYGGKISKYNKRTGEVINISPRPKPGEHFRFVRTEPVIFSPVDKKTLYYAGNVLFKTENGGNSWQVISPDLSRKTWDIPKSVGIYNDQKVKDMPRRGVIFTVAPSPVDINTIWAGTDDGLIQVTRDGGKNWNNVTPPTISSWSKISLMAAGHFDVNTAYAAVNRLRNDDLHPYIYKTHDGGKSWKLIVNGLPDEPINAVREDPKKKGLLFAASETTLYVSFDDGESWHSLRQNMPATSVRDVIVKDNDLAVATHGRGFWILDDMNRLRQIKPGISEQNFLFKPATAIRVRWNLNTDTPLPPDEPAGQNPPDGAIIDYYLKNDADDVSLDITNEEGKILRHYSNHDTLYKIPPVNVPEYWIRPQQILPATEGGHRFVWDLHTTPLNVPPSYPIAAIYKNTAPAPTSPWVMPGKYLVKLTVNGHTYKQPIVVKMDPRIHTSTAGLQQQYDLSILCTENRRTISDQLHWLLNSKQLAEGLKEKAGKNLSVQLDTLIGSLNKKLTNLSSLEGAFGGTFNLLQEADVAPTKETVAAVKDLQKKFTRVEEELKNIRRQIIPGMNKQLRQEGLRGIGDGK